ncbi:MAG: DUF983 domain-containing protein [Henriciella sp.]|nr:DUF983 domain-containing protein [Henriciella sp.]
MFGSYLKFNDKCDHCGLDFTIADTADGPAFFVGFLVMIVFAPFYFILPMVEMPIFGAILAWTVLIGLMGSFTYFLLPRFKAVLFNLQTRHKAEEAQFESTGRHGSAANSHKT